MNIYDEYVIKKTTTIFHIRIVNSTNFQEFSNDMQYSIKFANDAFSLSLNNFH